MACLKKESNPAELDASYWFRNPQELYEFFKPEGLTLDLGTGRGVHLKQLIKSGLPAIGLDKDIEALKKTGLKNLVCADAAHLPFREGVFDSILCTEILEHLIAPENCIREVSRVLKRQGRACFTTPCLNMPLKKIVPFYRKALRIKVEGGPHLHIFSTTGLVKELKSFFTVEKIKYRDFTIILQRLFANQNFMEPIDTLFSKITENIPVLKLFAGANFIIVRKR